MAGGDEFSSSMMSKIEPCWGVANVSTVVDRIVGEAGAVGLEVVDEREDVELLGRL